MFKRVAIAIILAFLGLPGQCLAQAKVNPTVNAKLKFPLFRKAEISSSWNPESLALQVNLGQPPIEFIHAATLDVAPFSNFCHDCPLRSALPDGEQYSTPAA